MSCYKFLIVLSLLAPLIVAKSTKRLQIHRPPKAYNPEFCGMYPPNTYFPHDNCQQFYECDEFGNLLEGWCPDDSPVFDEQGLFCGTVDNAVCFVPDYPEYPEYPEYPTDDSECPWDATEISFLPGDYCDEYYICSNGVPNLMTCRNGQHWNEAENYCDDPHAAGCDPNHPPSLPECDYEFTGTMPHPHNCNWFVYCNKGNRSIQQCQHLFHFDANLKQCIIMNRAVCSSDVK